MKVTEAAQNPAKPIEEAIWSRKQYLDTARGHYLSALAGLSGSNKQEQAKISHCIDSSLLLEDNAFNQTAEAEQASTLGQQGQVKTSVKMDVRVQLPNGVLKTCEKDLQAVKLQLNKTIARNTKSQITGMVCKLGSFGKEMDINDVAELKSTRTVSSESDDAKESLTKAMVESSSLHKMVESLKAELENLKKEHAELKDVDAEIEFYARNLHLRLLESKLENEGCLAKRDKSRQTSGEVTQAKVLKRERDVEKLDTVMEKKPRFALDVDEAKDGTMSAHDQPKSFPEGIYPACVSTSESSARIIISEDELDSSSQQVEKSAKSGSGPFTATREEIEGDKCDYASEFSIRDFVFAARNKDISMNWPFSQKNLQLCLKHGVKDVLPPFQPTDSLRAYSMEKCFAEKNLQSEEISLDEKQSILKNHLAHGTALEPDHSWNQELAEGYRDSDLFPTGVESDSAFKTIATANSQSEVESVSTSNLPLSEVSDEREAAASAVNNKTNSSASQLSNKKCKVAVKMRINSKRNTPEDITSACTVPPEAMSSKICPVCENFSSSSNTTLNAHIDQCLSSQSPPIWMKNTKLIKPRIKPRKMRLMTDICTTAPCCTLEDLDRRNGTNWASNVDLPLEDAEEPAEQKDPGVSPRYIINNVDDGSVYIDSSGRKIRILSKLNDTSTSFSKAREDLRLKKKSRKEKRSKFFLPNRKKRLAKHLKYIKGAHQSKPFSSRKVKGHSGEACGTEGAICAVGDKHIGQQQSYSFVKRTKAQEHSHPSVAGTASRLISLKISNLLKKNDSESITKLCRYEIEAARDLLIGNDQVGGAQVESRRASFKKHLNFPKRSLSSIQNNLRTPGIQLAEVEHRSQGSCRGKTLGGPSLTGAIQGHRDVFPVSLKVGVAQFNGEIAKESAPKFSDSTTVPAPHLAKEVDIQPNALQNSVVTAAARRKLLRSLGSSEGMRPRSSKTNMLSPNRSCVPLCQANLIKMGSALENSYDCSGDEEPEAWSADTSQQYGAMVDHPKSIKRSNSLGRISEVKLQQKQALKHGQDGLRDMNRGDELVDGTCGKYGFARSVMKGLHNDREVIAPVSSSSSAIGVNEISLRAALDTELDRVADVSQSNSLRCSENFLGHLFRAEARGNSSQPGRSYEHEMFYENVADVESLKLKTGDYILSFGHGSSFLEVDPIPIPGPPGSDLPSFSDMGSEDLHRSSLCSSLAQPSGNVDDVMDGDLTESPSSATSTISNLCRTDDFNSNEQESLGASFSVPNNVYSGWLGACSRPLPGISTVSSQLTAVEIKRATSDKGMISLGVGAATATLNRDNKSCCCSQKESITWGNMNSQESQPLRRRPTSVKSIPGGNRAYSTLDGQLNGLEDRTAVFSSSSYHRAESANLAHSLETSHQSIMSHETTAEAAEPFPGTGNYNSANLSAPILRLMGKDLRVSRGDTDLSRPQAAVNIDMNRLVHPVTQWRIGFSGFN